jgi:hypothetical protein
MMHRSEVFFVGETREKKKKKKKKKLDAERMYEAPTHAASELLEFDENPVSLLLLLL